MPKRILLAEDSLTIQKVFELTFARSDFALTTVDNGTDAVRLASEVVPDLVVADVTLPGRNGFEVAVDLAASPSTRNCPVLILSGSLGPFDEESFKKCGARGVLFKPFESQELIDKVNELLTASGAAGGSQGESAAPGGDDWDFSDVLEAVDDGGGKAAGAGFVAAAEAGSPSDEGLSLGEFDVSVDELGTAEPSVPEAAPAPVADTDPVAPVDIFAEPPFSQDAPCEDEPAGITDISPALAAVEDLEEIEDLEEMELLHKESEGPLAVEIPPVPVIEPPAAEAAPADEGEVDLDAILGVADEPAIAPEPEPVPEPVPPAAIEPEPEPEPEPAPVVEPPAPVVPEEDLEAIIADVPAPEPVAAAVAEPAAPVASIEGISAEALRAQFSERAREIVEKVATEAVEKVMWEWMDRLSAEFTERIRESVESVAWDVIPKTAETLIREEIARIRDKEGR
jgi:DNA-binding response OmpR family regulator